MIQNVLFCTLSCHMVFYKTHFVIQTITARRFSHACYHQRCGETSLASRLQLSRASSKTNPRLVMKQKTCPWGCMVELDSLSNLNARSLVSQSQSSHCFGPFNRRWRLPSENPFLPNCFKRDYPDRVRHVMPSKSVRGKWRTAGSDNLKQLIYGNRVDGLIFLIPTRMIPRWICDQRQVPPSSSLERQLHLCIASG